MFIELCNWTRWWEPVELAIPITKPNSIPPKGNSEKNYCGSPKLRITNVRLICMQNFISSLSTIIPFILFQVCLELYQIELSNLHAKFSNLKLDNGESMHVKTNIKIFRTWFWRECMFERTKVKTRFLKEHIPSHLNQFFELKTIKSSYVVLGWPSFVIC